MNPHPLAPLQIGSLAIPFPVLLAPMAGYTDAAFRTICADQGCGLAYTEVVNSEGVIRHSRPTLFLFETAPGERPLAAHIYGCRPEVMAEAAAIIESLGRFDLIDINAGCPVRKIVAKGCGAALMQSPELVYRIVKAVTQAVSLPVTLKTRTGIQPDKPVVDEVAHAAEEGGIAALALHARAADLRHGGPADWESLARVKAQCGVPVIGNGGVAQAEDVFRMMRETGVDGVMIGRAAIGNPWIFEDARRIARGSEPRAHSLEEHKNVLGAHLRRLAQLKTKDPRCARKGADGAQRGAALQFRPFLLKYLSGFEARAEVRRNLQRIGNLADIETIVQAALSPPPQSPARDS